MRKRLRSTCKWGGTVLTVLLLVVWVGSAWVLVARTFRPNMYAGIVEGRVELGWLRPPASWTEGRWVDTNSSPALRWWFSGAWDSGPPSAGFTVDIPLWVPSLLTGLTTVWLWRRDRRKEPGLCFKCGYDLRGADHKVCPECGATPLPSRTTS